MNIDFYENALSKQSAVIDSKNLEISLLHHELEQMKLKRMRERREIKLLQTELEYLEENWQNCLFITSYSAIAISIWKLGHEYIIK